MRRDRLEQRISAIEKLAREVLEQTVQLRKELLAREESAEVMFERMALEVLSEIERRGGAVSRDEVLDIGETVGYGRQGMAGFYQRLLELKDGTAHLTAKARERLMAQHQGPET